MKPPDSASARASKSRCTALSCSPWAWRATAWSTITLSRMYSSLTDGELVRLRQVSGCCQMALVQQRQHLGGRHFRDARHKVVLARGLSGLGEQSDPTGHISPGQFQAGEQHLTGNDSVCVF